MSEYFYKAKDNNSKIISGKIKASSITDAAIKLEQKMLTVLEILEDEKATKKEHIQYEETHANEDKIFSISEKIEFFNAFYFMYKSGTPISGIFNYIFNSSKNRKIKSLCLKVTKKVEKGLSLKDAFLKEQKALGIAYTTLIITGEEAGKLDNILSSIIANLKREDNMKRNLISAISYPCFILCLAIAVFLLFKLFVLKAFESIGTGGLSSCSIKNMLIGAIIQIIIIFGCLFGGIFYIYKNKKLLNQIINFFSKLKPIESILKNFYFYNFFMVLSLAYQAGITSAQSIELANSLISISSIKTKLKKAQQRIQNGCQITTALSAANVFPQNVISQISTGEQAGELDKMYLTIAYNYETKIDSAIKIMSKLLEPIFIGIVGLIVLYVVSTAYKSYYSNLFSI